jgi:phosphatidate cytidylyltransferase
VKRILVGAWIFVFVLAAFALSLLNGVSAQIFVMAISVCCLIELVSILPSAHDNTAQCLVWLGQTLLVILAMLIAVIVVPTKNDILILFATMCTIFVEDVMSLVVGKSLSTPHLPGLLGRVSPNKTIGGSLGGIVIGNIAGILFALGLELVGTLHVDAKVFIVIFFVTILAPAGDLFESAMKRKMGVKDSGEVLRAGRCPFARRIEGFMEPHGGFMDRFDSFFPVLIFLAILKHL